MFLVKPYNYFPFTDFKDNCLNPATPSLLSLEFLEITVPITIGKCQSPLSLQLPHPLRDSNKSIMTHFMNMGSQACLAPQHMDSSHQWESSRSPETTALIQVSMKIMSFVFPFICLILVGNRAFGNTFINISLKNLWC